MLSLLHIENIAVVEKADIEFAAGLNILTGETGAGKSIVIDALGAVLGGRVSRDLVRTGAKGAAVTAVFENIGSQGWFEENGIEPEDELVLMRKIAADGKSACRVNGTPVTAAQLRALGENLLNIHGQHDGQLLLSEGRHLGYLDSFGGHTRAVEQYKECFDRYRKALKERNRVRMDEGEKARRIDQLELQISELEEAAISPGQAAEMTVRRDLLSNAGKLSESVNEAFYAIHGGDEQQGAVDYIGQAQESIDYAFGYSAEFKELSAAIEDLKYAAEDIAEQLRDIKESLEFSPEELDNIEQRLSLINRLMRKYGGTEEQLLESLESCKLELSEITYSDEMLAKLDKVIKQRKGELMSAGSKLTQMRKDAAEKLEKRIISELQQLSMQGIQFAVDISPRGEFDVSGIDAVKFLMSANAGEKLGRISKIASGGELARIMLAMKNVLAESEEIGTMVFDEIDTGVSGIAAQRVGEKLSDLAKRRQVLCVTHLPQIAAMSDTHFSIQKNVIDGRTFTDVKALDREGREQEIARLTGGENITGLTLKSAGEMLDAAKRYKERF